MAFEKGMTKTGGKKAGTRTLTEFDSPEVVADAEKILGKPKTEWRIADKIAARKSRFVSAYVTNGLNAKAAVAAATNKSVTDKTCSNKAVRLMRDPEVVAKIDHLISYEEIKSVVTPGFVLGNLARLALEAKRDDSRIKATELLGRWLKLWGDDGAKAVVNIVTSEELAAIRQRLGDAEAKMRKELPKVDIGTSPKSCSTSDKQGQAQDTGQAVDLQVIDTPQVRIVE